MSSAGAQAGVLAPVALCHWPCRPRAWANSLSIWSWARSSWALRRSSNGYHWVLSIIWFSLVLGPQRRPPARGQRSPGACSGCTCRVTPPYSERCSSVKNTVHYSSGDHRGCPRHLTAQPGRRRAPAERGLGERPRSGGCGTAASDRGQMTPWRPRAKPPATASPIGPPAPHSRAAVRSHSAAAGPGWAPQLLVTRRGGSRRWSATKTPRAGCGRHARVHRIEGAVVDQDMLVDGGGGLPGPDRCPAQAAASSALGWGSSGANRTRVNRLEPGCGAEQIRPGYGGIAERRPAGRPAPNKMIPSASIGRRLIS